MRPRSLHYDHLTPWHAAGAVLLMGLGILATLPAWQDIFTIAMTNEEYSHIFLVPPIALALIWIRRIRIRQCRPTGTLAGPLIVAAGWLLGWYGFHHAVQSFWHGGAVLVAIGCAVSVLGRDVLVRFFPAILILFFLVPVPGRIHQMIALPLQTWTAQVAEVLLTLMGYATMRSGNLLNINGVDVMVAEACNGLRMVFALILVSYAFAFALPLRNSVRVLVLLASPLAAVFCNVLRILPTVWLYGFRSPEFAEQFHDASGWIMLPIAFLLLYGIIRLLKWAMIPVTRYTLAAQ